MDSTPSKSEISLEFLPFLRIYEDGHVERLLGTDYVPPSTDPETGVSSKDIVVVPEDNVSARIFLPKLTQQSQKFPLLIHFHGGGFCVSSPFTARYSNYVKTIVNEANVIAVSVNYRKAPENPIPAAYEDSWAALHWAASHRGGGGPEEWLNLHADFDRVFLAGDSSGGNIAHNVAMAAGNPELELALEILGVALIHPYFWGMDPIGSEALDQEKKALVDRLWPFICPSSPSNDDPRVNPVAEGAPSISELGCKRVLVCVAKDDPLRDRGWLYYEALSRSGWMGVVEIMETEGETHAFYLDNLDGEKSRELIQRLAAFLNRDPPPFFQ